MRPSREGYPSIAFTLFMILGSLFFAPIVALFLVPMLLFVVWYYRDPERSPEGEGYLSPSDGVVTRVERGEYPAIGKALRISISTGVMDVHVNRSPCAGSVGRLVRFPAKMSVGTASSAPRKWEKIIVEIFTNRGPVTVTHSAGFPGRNISCGLMKGRELERGGRYAVIASGARTDLYLPPDTEPCAAEGGNVFAGRTVLALINHGGQ